MWPFRKRKPQLDRLPIDGPWSLGSGQHDGKVMIVRSNKGYRAFGSVAGYEHQVGVAVTLCSPEPNGLPSPAENAENKELGAIEDTISNALQVEAESLLVAIITTGGMREFVFYTRAPQQVEERFANLRESLTSHEIQLMIQPDKTWGLYAQLT